MAQVQTAPYGAWKSPVSADLVASGGIRLGQLGLYKDYIYWIELRPAEGGRNVLVRRAPDGTTTDVTPPGFNVRTRVHEYGGISYVIGNDIVYFSNFLDQRVYWQAAPQALPQPLTPEVDLRYADMQYDPQRNRLIAVREDHSQGGEAVNTIVSLEITDGAGDGERILVSGNDFYSNPRLSPDGSKLAWLTWNHPNMPWDGTELWIASLNADGNLEQPQLVAGGKTESIFQPEWSPAGVLHFVSDRTGWWNLYRWNNGQVEALYPKEAEFGQPAWVFGMTSYGFASANQIVCTFIEKDGSKLAVLDSEKRQLDLIELPYTDLGGLKVSGNTALFMAGSATQPASIIKLDLTTRRHEVLKCASELNLDAGYLSEPQAVEYPTEDGLTAFGYFYPPKNQDFAAPSGEKPPLLVKTHGGPTASTSTTFNPEIQYWTSRGFAILDVNYGGSTGYGRAYRQRLNDRWGIVDVDDCVNGARYLVEKGLADGNRLAIDGGSAGGYTTLAVLTFRRSFKAGASYFGVSDLEALAKDTHKFESRYLDGLIGPYPERRDLYLERSPIHHTDQLNCPMILLQGLEDKVVPPNQAEMMFDAVKAKGLPVAYIPFEGEQHGFRQAKNIKRSLEAEFYFYSKIFGFEPADAIEPVKIENLG